MVRIHPCRFLLEALSGGEEGRAELLGAIKRLPMIRFIVIGRAQHGSERANKAIQNDFSFL